MKQFAMAQFLLVDLVMVTLRYKVINGVVGHIFKSIECQEGWGLGVFLAIVSDVIWSL